MQDASRLAMASRMLNDERFNPAIGQIYEKDFQPLAEKLLTFLKEKRKEYEGRKCWLLWKEI